MKLLENYAREVNQLTDDWYAYKYEALPVEGFQWATR